MDAQLKSPDGMIQHDDLLNVLLAIWKMEYASIAKHPGGLAKSHLAGVEEALQARGPGNWATGKSSTHKKPTTSS